VNGKINLAQIRKGARSGIWKGPRPMKALVLGCIDGAQKMGIVSFLASTPQYSRQTYAINAPIIENIEKCYKDRNIYILSDGQAAIKALNNFQINSKLVWDCHQSLVKLTEHKRVQLVWVQGNMGIDGNEMADRLAMEGSSHPPTAPEPALGIPAKVAKQVIRDWTNMKHEKHRQSMCGQGQVGFLKKTIYKKSWRTAQSGQKPAKNNDQAANRDTHSKGPLCKLGTVNSPKCDTCKQASEMVSHVLCDCGFGHIKILAPEVIFYETR
jgi:hypothetical protein